MAPRWPPNGISDVTIIISNCLELFAKVDFARAPCGRERYPSFVDAVRDLDDPLTLVHLFSLLPADKRHGIPNEVVTRARTLGRALQLDVALTPD